MSQLATPAVKGDLTAGFETLDRETRVERLPLEGRLPEWLRGSLVRPGPLTTAHPHLDRASGGMLNYAAKIGPRNRYRFFHVPPDETKPRVIGELPVKQPAYMHSFGLTERWLVLAEFPLVVNPISIPLSGRPYIENYRWKPELGTRITLVDRA